MLKEKILKQVRISYDIKSIVRLKGLFDEQETRLKESNKAIKYLKAYKNYRSL